MDRINVDFYTLKSKKLANNLLYLHLLDFVSVVFSPVLHDIMSPFLICLAS